MPPVQRLARFGNLPHQDRRRVQVPVGIRDMRMTEIGAEGYNMAGDFLAVVATLLKRADGEGVCRRSCMRGPG
jgi:hypothetical protein